MLIDPSTALFLVVFLVIVFDALIGDPDFLWSRLPHPVVLIGKLIGWLDTSFNNPARQSPEANRLLGVLSLGFVLCIAFAVGWIINIALASLGWVGLIVSALLGSFFIAQKSMIEHVQRVLEPLQSGDIEGARAAVSMIVGRDPAKLNEASIGRAAIESTAENFSDGVVAPVFWFLLLGLPGLITYKALNTADSMIGHKNIRYYHYGWAAARLDDFANWLPARLACLFIVLSPPHKRKALSERMKTILSDAPRHRSPNAGWPEAAMAVKLGVSLSGPRFYGDRLHNELYVNEAARKRLPAIMSLVL